MVISILYFYLIDRGTSAPVFLSYGSHFQFAGAYLAPVLTCFHIHCYIIMIIIVNNVEPIAK